VFKVYFIDSFVQETAKKDPAQPLAVLHAEKNEKNI
jgi:hypothetical protein